MSGTERLKKAHTQVASLLMPDKVRVERLRQILEAEQHRSVSYEEANEIGRELISFFECLAGDRKIVRGSLPRSDIYKDSA